MATPVASLTQLCQYQEESWYKYLLAMLVFWKTLRILQYLDENHMLALKKVKRYFKIMPL